MSRLKVIGFIFTAVGSIAGAIALILTVSNQSERSKNSYLQLTVQAEQTSSTTATVLAQMENKSESRQYITYAALIVFPSGESGSDVLSKLATCLNTTLMDKPSFLVNRPDEPALCDNGERRIIPIPFFYAEQRYIGDEKISTRIPINTSSLPPHVSAYIVRFVVWSQEGNQLRSTEDLLLRSPAATLQGSSRRVKLKQ